MDATSNTCGFVDLALDKLKRFYTDRNRITELGAELLVYQQLMPALISKLEPTYELIEPVGLGSTAIVWKVMDNGLKPPQPRALKLTRPNKSRSDEIVRIIRGEPLTLASLNHQNIIKVFTYSEISFDLDGASYKFPYFVMEFLAERSNFDDAILTASKKLNYAVIIDFFRDALSGIDAHILKILFIVISSQRTFWFLLIDRLLLRISVTQNTFLVVVTTHKSRS